MSTGWDLERREKQREVAKRLVEEGKFGGAGRGQGRPRKKRASEVVADLTSAEGQDIFDRMMEIVRGGNDGNSISAARTLLETEEKERKLQLEEEQSYEHMRGNELSESIMNLLYELSANGTIELPIVEGEFTPLTEGSADRTVEELGSAEDATE
jgi:hypothetical protein